MASAILTLASVFLTFVSASDATQQLDVSAAARTRRALRQASTSISYGATPDHPATDIEGVLIGWVGPDDVRRWFIGKHRQNVCLGFTNLGWSPSDGYDGACDCSRFRNQNCTYKPCRTAAPPPVEPPPAMQTAAPSLGATSTQDAAPLIHSCPAGMNCPGPGNATLPPGSTSANAVPVAHPGEAQAPAPITAQNGSAGGDQQNAHLPQPSPHWPHHQACATGCKVGVACGAAAILLLAVGFCCLVIPALSSRSDRARFSPGGTTAATPSAHRDVGYSGDQVETVRQQQPEPLPPGTDTGTYRAGRPFPPPFSAGNEHMPALGIPVEKVWGHSGVPGEPVTPR